jgi:hypothetical protein
VPRVRLVTAMPPNTLRGAGMRRRDTAEVSMPAREGRGGGRGVGR